MDFVIALLAVIVLSPFIALLALLIKIDSKGPVLFRQKRVGKGKRLFNILKFRTMRIDTPHDCPTHLLDNAQQYITRMGAFMRKTSLDELPQLLNILAGQMSLVGPRPALWNQYDLIAKRDCYGANDIRPGLTGWAQINGRDELPIDIKARLDGDYVKSMGLVLDCKILLMTVFKVCRREGVREGAEPQITNDGQHLDAKPAGKTQKERN
nr:sugar transferase [Maliibacterium massiliense]